MKKFYLGVVLFVLMTSCLALTECKQTKTVKEPVATDEQFTLTVGAESFKCSNEVMENFTSRDLPGMEFTVDYLSSIADAAIAFTDIIGTIKGDKITTYQFWIKIIPATLPHTKTFFNAFTKAVKVNELYKAVGTLTPEEQLAVGLKLKTKFKNLPLGDAEKLANTILRAALINTQLVIDINELKNK